MIWGNAHLSPALGLSALLLLALALVVTGSRLLGRGWPARTAALLALGLALLVPISAAFAALPFSFSNGTVADATQVNANFNVVQFGGASKTSAGGGNEFLALNTVVVMDQLSYTAPAAGVVHVEGSGFCTVESASTTMFLTVESDQSTTQTGLSNSHAAAIAPAETSSGSTLFPYFVDNVFAVTAGAHTAFLLGSETAGAPGSDNCHAHVTVTWAPAGLP
jgi:hypothetical protein